MEKTRTNWTKCFWGLGGSEKEHIKQKIILGYDLEKWVSAEAKIRGEEHHELEYHDLATIQPTKGKHKFAHCQVLYEEVHPSLKKRKWAPIKTDIEVAGITWIELFALYDLTGNRSVNDQHQKDPGAMKCKVAL